MIPAIGLLPIPSDVQVYNRHYEKRNRIMDSEQIDYEQLGRAVVTDYMEYNIRWYSA